MGITQSGHRSNIMWAAQTGRLQDLLYHLRAAQPEDLDSSRCMTPKRQAPIHVAAIRGHPRCIQALREAGSKLNELDEDGYSPLHLTVAHGQYGCVKMLLQLGAKVNIKNRFGITPLHIAASIGHTYCIDELVRWGANINAQESWGQTPLIIATLKNRVECMKALVHMGADTEIRDYHHNDTALHIACASRDEESVLILLDAGADVTVENGLGQSAIGVALVNKFYSVIPLLVEYGARLNKVDREHLPMKLQSFIDRLTDSPLSLLRLCRVTVRQMMGPATFDTMLPSFELPSSLEDFMKQMKQMCDDRLIKQAALQGLSEEYWKEREAQALL